MRRAEEDGATLVVNSDHGFKWGADRPCERSSLNRSTAAFWHRLDGVFAAWGARVRSEPERGHARRSSTSRRRSRRCWACPVDRRWRARVIARGVPRSSPPPARKDLFATVPVRRVAGGGRCRRRRRASTRRSCSRSGTCPAREPRAARADRAATRPGMTEGGWNNLGLYLRENTKDLAAAEAAFEKSLALRPDYHSPQFNLAVLYRAARRRPEGRSTGSSARSRPATPTRRGRSCAGRRSTDAEQGPAAAAACSSGRAARTRRARRIAPRARPPALPGEGLPGRPGAPSRRFEAATAGPGHAERPRALRDLPRPPGRGHRALPAGRSRSSPTSPASSSR